MKKNILFLFLVGLYLIPLSMPFDSGIAVSNYSIASDPWLDGFSYRNNITITGATGAGTNYQVMFNITYNSYMQTDFDDLRFTDDDGTTELDYWIQNKTDSSFALVWVEVADNLGSDRVVCMYYGNSTVSSTTNGYQTFTTFFDKENDTGWTTNHVTVTGASTYLGFYNPVPTYGGECYRYDITTETKFQMMVELKSVTLGASDNFVMITLDGSTSHRMSQTYTPSATNQAKWYYYDGSNKVGGDWEESQDDANPANQHWYIMTHTVDTSDSVTGVDYILYDTSWNQLSSITSENFALGSPTVIDGLYVGDASGSATCDIQVHYIAFRKWVSSDPLSYSIGVQEPSSWHEVDAASGIIFYLEADITAINWFLIFGGLAMVPFSTLYLVKGGRDEMSLDKTLIFLMILFVGIALFIGGIYS